MGLARKFGSSRPWLAVMCVLVVALLTAQAMHVHSDDGLSVAKCQICVSAHSSAPVTAVMAQILLVAIASVVIVRQLQEPSADSVLPLFIRPPPSA